MLWALWGISELLPIKARFKCLKEFHLGDSMKWCWPNNLILKCVLSNQNFYISRWEVDNSIGVSFERPRTEKEGLRVGWENVWCTANILALLSTIRSIEFDQFVFNVQCIQCLPEYYVLNICASQTVDNYRRFLLIFRVWNDVIHH